MVPQHGHICDRASATPPILLFLICRLLQSNIKAFALP
jgi:hypothetical protein